MATPKLKVRIEGCLLGVAVGDALGAPVETQDQKEIESYILKHVKTLDFKGVVREYEGPFPFGQVTDDTQLTLLLHQSLREQGQLCCEHFAQLLAQAKLVGGGGTTKSAIRNLQKGLPWWLAGRDSPGNGPAISIAPLAIHTQSSDPIVKMAQACWDYTRITHRNHVAFAGSLIQCLFLRLVLTGIDPDGQDFWDIFRSVLSMVFGTDHPLHSQIRWIRDRKQAFPRQVLNQIQAWYPDPYWRFPGVSPHALQSVLWSLFAFLRSPYNFMQAMETALWPGGDVDSTAAMTGAISGAFLGAGQIPYEVKTKIHDRDEWDYKKFLTLCQEL